MKDESNLTPLLYSRYKVHFNSILDYNVSIIGVAQHSTAQHTTAQYSTAHYSTVQHSTVQYSTVQHHVFCTGNREDVEVIEIEILC